MGVGVGWGPATTRVRAAKERPQLPAQALPRRPRVGRAARPQNDGRLGRELWGPQLVATQNFYFRVSCLGSCSVGWIWGRIEGSETSPRSNVGSGHHCAAGESRQPPTSAAGAAACRASGVTWHDADTRGVRHGPLTSDVGPLLPLWIKSEVESRTHPSATRKVYLAVPALS
ncbi:hypothetical protein MUK42_24998 [Musa troglodytarum]|uniref:Uncharacterized protein n=1 Tax=Musa troglodytarum TaxID=320322 RepID=A0A9E7I8Z7_9LILI|nr:hypothetical protein MUK42_24998 [Musa troglodytarum]